MGVSAIYKCDKCLKEQDSGEQMWEVGIVLRHWGPQKYMGLHDARQKVLWCRKCTDELSLTSSLVLDPEFEHPAPPTFEDLVRQIVQDENNNRE